MTAAPTTTRVAEDRPKRRAGVDQGAATVSAPLARVLLVPASAVVIVMCILPLAYFIRFSFVPQGTAGATSDYTFANYEQFFTTSAYITTLLRTLVIAFSATALGVVLAIPVARWISTMGAQWRTIALVATVFPMLVGDVIRAIGWASMVGYSGLLKQALVTIGLVGPDADLQHTEITIVIAMASAVLPILVLILEATFEGINPDVERASQSLGVAPTKTFFKVVLPQAVPGLIAASSLIFVMSVNTFSVPLLIGGSQIPMMAPVVYETIAQGNNWELGSAMAVTLLVLSLSIVALYSWLIKRQFDRWRTVA